MQVPREGLEQKLQRLSQSQQSIESVSSFCIFYHKDAKGVVNIWEAEFYKAPADRKLALLYLANHILQEGRKKGMGFQEEYFKVLPKAVGHIAKHGDDKARRSVTRMVNVWEERRVFGTRHIKSFKEILGPSADAVTKSAPATAAAAGSGSSTAAVATSLGPVGEALSVVLQQAVAAAANGQEFASSWSAGVLTSGGLPELTSAHSKLQAYQAALQQEVQGRKTALAALQAELTRQRAELSRAEGQLVTTDRQSADLQARLAALTSQMTSAMASLGQLFQQNGAGAAAGAPAAAASAAAALEDAGGSPQAPELELEEDDDAGVPIHNTAAPMQPATAAAAAPGTMPAGFDPSLLNMLQQQQQPSLQTWLQNPGMLSAAITGGTGLGTAGAAPAAGAGMPFSFVPGMQQQHAMAAGGMQLGLPSGPPHMLSAAAADMQQYSVSAAAGAGSRAPELQGHSIAGDGMQHPGAFDLQQQQSGFADEGEDPYDPEHFE